MAFDSHIAEVQTEIPPTAHHIFNTILEQTPENTKLVIIAQQKNNPSELIRNQNEWQWRRLQLCVVMFSGSLTLVQIPKAFWVKYCDFLSSQVKPPCGSRGEIGLMKSSDGKIQTFHGFLKPETSLHYLVLGPTRKKKTSPYGKSEVKFDLSDNISGESSLPRWKEPQNIVRKQMFTGKEKAEALTRDKGFKSDDPFFIVLMQPSFVGASYSMVVPFSFAKNHLLSVSKHEDVILKVQGERIWPVRYYYRKYTGRSQFRFAWGWKAFAIDNNLKVGRTLKVEALKIAKDFKSKDPFFIVPMQPSSVGSKSKYNMTAGISSIFRIEGGWKAFVQDNDLKVGDVCAFVLRKSIGIILFEVVIFHENGVANSPIVPIPGLSIASEAASKFFSNNPYFQLNLRSAHVRGHAQLYIPLAIANSWFEKKSQTVILWVGKEYWHVNLTINKGSSSSGLEHRFSAGWRAFTRDNSLNPTDICIFELIKKNQAEIKVMGFLKNRLLMSSRVITIEQMREGVDETISTP
ncbi:hypothetical protein F8388_019873 [Cannabis sativa]|uniref:TF-B3 domain-containing protein n=1 Tax=Cannabis sativa TaxID=3483 RepID=A0A7J6H6F9_CANSA|nr:hypothetical protein F8388_019873 [Cannabis sativa]